MTKPTKWHVRPAKTQISLGIRQVWSEFSLSARRKLGSLATHWAHSEDSDQTGRMPRLIWVFAGHTCQFFGFVTRWLILLFDLLHVLTVSSSKVWQWIVTFLLWHNVWHHVGIIYEWGHSQPLHNDIREMVWIQHQVLLTVLQEIFIVPLLIFTDCLHCNHTRIQTIINVE